MRIVRVRVWVIAALTVALIPPLVACSTQIRGTGSTAPPPATSGTSTRTNPAAVPPSAEPSTAVERKLAAELLPAPSGYALSTSADAENGPLTPAEYDKGSPTGSATARELGYLDGYGLTYDGPATTAPTQDRLSVALLQFATAADAKQFVMSGTPAGPIAQQAPTMGPLPGIAGSLAIDANNPYSDGSFDHIVNVYRGTIVVALTYNNVVVGTPPELVQWTQDQLRLLRTS